MSENNKENFKNAICYIPLVAFFLYFTEKKTTEEFKKHIKYGMMLFIIYVITTTVLSVLWMGWLNGLVVLAYIGISIFLGFKAYNGEKVDVKILNDISDKFKETTGKKK
ncbi:hypothetical protein LRZ95_01690 [Candidatus Gracilibacteria bacterium]|nr:hypothetical protein [Candidatus Gracilibacteria bacterium]